MPHSPPKTDIFLQPGEYFVGDASLRLRTMLGSCVAITLWHPQRKIGAMSHFLLAEHGGRRRTSNTLDGRYGDEALESGHADHAAQVHRGHPAGGEVGDDLVAPETGTRTDQ